MNNETKKVKWYNRLFAILGIILVLVAGVFSGFKLGEAYMQEQDPTVTFASVDINGTTYDWAFVNSGSVFPSAQLINANGSKVWFDGQDYIWSNKTYHMSYDFTNNSWSNYLTFTGVSSFTGSMIGYVGNNIYYVTSNGKFYSLDNTRRNWVDLGFSALSSRYTLDGVYFSSSISIVSVYDNDGDAYLGYKVDFVNHSLVSLTIPNNLRYLFNASDIWFDGTTLHYDYQSANHYSIDTTTGAFTSYTWSAGDLINNDLTGKYVFSDGTSYYYIGGSTSGYVLQSNAWVNSDFALTGSFGMNYFGDLNNNFCYLYHGSMFKLVEVQSGGGGTTPDVPGSDSVVDTYLSQAISINTIGMMQNYDSTDPNWIVQDWHDCANAYFYFSIDATTVETTSEITVGFNFTVSGVIYSGSETFNVGDEDNAGDGGGYIELTNQNYDTVISVDVDFSEYGLVSNLNFYRVMYSSSYDTDTISGTNYRYRYDMLTLTNFDTGFIRFTFSGVASQVDNADWYNIMNYTGWCDDVHTRTYYLTYALSNNESYDTGYDQGFADGSSAGSADGYTDGYDDGYGAGYNVGYGAGYNTGASDSNQYTFINLIGATIDAPISAFRGLFNFSVFGVNMTDFLTALFSITLVIVILKFVLVK